MKNERDLELEQVFAEAARHFSIEIQTAVQHLTIGYIPVVIECLDSVRCAFWSFESVDHEFQVRAMTDLLAEEIYASFLAPCYLKFDDDEFRFLFVAHKIIEPNGTYIVWH